MQHRGPHRRRTAVVTFLIVLLAAFLIWRMVRPLNIFVVDPRFERPMSAPVPWGLASVKAEECGRCHDAIYREWSRSMHAQAWTEPYFQVDYRYDGTQQICLNCHTPLVNQQPDLVLGFKDRDKFKPLLKPNPAFDPALRNEGVTCAVCHVREGTIVGPFTTDRAPHAVTVDPEMGSGIKSCERCHVVSGKRWDTFYDVPPCGTVVEIERREQKPDCPGCHMPRVSRPVVQDGLKRTGGRHWFRGGHDRETVKKALTVTYGRQANGYQVILTNRGAAHYLPTGTPDRHLTLELRLVDARGKVLQDKTYTMKRYILWRPFIVDLWDTRLPHGKPRSFDFRFAGDADAVPSALEVDVRYHLLDESRRKKIGYENQEPIAYPIYHARIPL